ncbi:hypothetical protein KIPB_001382, partial [Kipferlia bialata]|eukprot:g1382.t1
MSTQDNTFASVGERSQANVFGFIPWHSVTGGRNVMLTEDEDDDLGGAIQM